MMESKHTDCPTDATEFCNWKNPLMISGHSVHDNHSAAQMNKCKHITMRKVNDMDLLTQYNSRTEVKVDRQRVELHGRRYDLDDDGIR
jgi:hypothetical protein